MKFVLYLIFTLSVTSDQHSYSGPEVVLSHFYEEQIVHFWQNSSGVNFTNIFHAAFSLVTWLSFYAFGICERKSCT